MSARAPAPFVIRPCIDADREAILAIVNAAAQAYRGVIPPDRWHDPYMSAAELAAEIAAGVRFAGFESDGALVGVMGVQSVRNVALIRHAYVAPDWQGRGVGAALMAHSRAGSDRPFLVGAWEAASWASRFYERNGFALVAPEAKAALLRAYWTISERQIETSVVLSSRPLSAESARDLIAAA